MATTIFVPVMGRTNFTGNLGSDHISYEDSPEGVFIDFHFNGIDGAKLGWAEDDESGIFNA